MNLSELRAAVLRELKMESGTGVETTDLDPWINRAIKKIWSSRFWEFRKNYTELTNIYTLCSGAGTSTGTTLYVDSNAGMAKGQYLWVNDGTNFEMVRIASISSLTITLDSPGLRASYTDGDYVAGANLFLPYKCQKVMNIRAMTISSTEQTACQMVPHPERNFFQAIDYIKGTGRPTDWYYGMLDDTDEGKTTNLVADSNTSTTQVVDSALAGHEDDYYNGWMLVNTNASHLGTSRVKDYTYSGKIITLESPINWQTTADTYFLERKLRQLFLYPIPDAAYRYKIEYDEIAPVLVNAYDYANFGEFQDEIEIAIIQLATAYAFIADNDPVAQTWLQLAKEQVDSAWFKAQLPTDGLLNMRPTKYDNLPGFVI